MIVRTPRAIQAFIQVEQLRSAAHLAFYFVVDVIAIQNRVHQFRVDRFFAQIRPRVHQRLKFIGCDLPRLADAFLDLVEP
jgi:hypothetical protein